MRVLPIAVLGVVLAGAVYSQQDAPNARPGASSLAPPADPAAHPHAYAVGFSLGGETRVGLATDGMGVDLDLVTKGFRDGLTGRDPLVRRGDMEEILVAVHREMESRLVKRLLAESPDFKRLYDRNLARSRQFHELFGKQDGVQTLESGSQFLVLRPGDGRPATIHDTVTILVEARTLTGTVIDDGKTPVDVELARITPGAREMLQRMGAGARWQVALPPEAAHGGAGRYPDIGPNETLVGTVEVVRITRAGSTPAG